MRRVMHWPESSLRFVLLEPSLKASLGNITTIFKRAGVTVTTPYRAKKDPDSCMLLEEGPTLSLAVAVARLWKKEYSTRESFPSLSANIPGSSPSPSSSGLVEVAAHYVGEFFRFVAAQLITVRLSLSSALHDSLVAKELGLLKELQGRHGVHLRALHAGCGVACIT